MPIYEYACPDCGHQFEMMQKFTDEPTKECPTCHAGNVKKLISRTNFVLAGGGWYKDHYGLKSPADSGGAGEKAGGAEKSGGEKSGSEAASAPAAPAATPAASAPAAAPAAPSTPSK